MENLGLQDGTTAYVQQEACGESLSHFGVVMLPSCGWWETVTEVIVFVITKALQIHMGIMGT